MSINEPIERQAVVDEARRWVATPYAPRAALLGVGVDCVQLLIQAFSGAGLIVEPEVERYSIDWHMHRNEEKYLEGIEQYAHRIDDEDTPLEFRPGFYASTGDIIVFRVGRTFSHGAIVTEWPFIIHAYQPSMIVEEVDVLHTPMSHRPARVYSYWGT
jgi:cell wall-associated NlpC family hydrolase